MDTKDENLRKLVEKMIHSRNAKKYIEDIQAGEEFLRKYPAPTPDDMLLANIKANMAMHKMPQRTVTFKKRVFEALAVAASIAIIATISLYSISHTPPEVKTPYGTASLLPQGWWTNEDEGHMSVINEYQNINAQVAHIGDEDADDTYIMLKKHIEQVEDQLTNVEASEESYRYLSSVDEYTDPSGLIEDVERRLNELNGSFWEDDYSNAGMYE